MNALSGLVLVDKPEGPTSHAVVSRMRRLAGTRKVGHAGTLDPMATGLLLVGLNRATRLLTHLVGLDKVYEATIRLGASTTTDDREGEVVARADPAALAGVDAALIEEALAGFRGRIEQVPSSVSAIKVDGRRAHERVRQGEEVELKARPVTIGEFVMTSAPRTVDGDDPGIEFEVRVACSSGTYIRALARDLGAGLGVGGHLTMLRRTAVGPFEVGQAAPLAALEEGATVLREVLLSPAEVATSLFPSVRLTEAQAQALREGRSPRLSAPDAPLAAMLAPDGSLVGLASLSSGAARVVMNLPVADDGGGGLG